MKKFFLLFLLVSNLILGYDKLSLVERFTNCSVNVLR
jgi:hypothetical protein